MIARTYSLFATTVPLLTVSYLSLAFFTWIPATSGPLDSGYFLGCLCAHATLAAAWIVFGPGPLLWRFPLSLIWVLLLGGATYVFILSQGFNPNDRPRLIATLLLGQWLTVQLAWWLLKVGLQVQLLHMNDDASTGTIRLQFGIRQLMLSTAAAGVIVLIGHTLISGMPTRYLRLQDDAVFHIFLVATATLTTPLLLFALSRHGVIVGVVVVLMTICVVTPIEDLLYTLSNEGDSLFDEMLATNFFASGLVLAAAITIRICGYRMVQLKPKSRKCLGESKGL